MLSGGGSHAGSRRCEMRRRSNMRLPNRLLKKLALTL